MKPKKLPVNELLRLACIYAEQDREGYLQAHTNFPDDATEVVEARAFIEQLREYRKKRWGKTKLEGWMDRATEVPVEDVGKRLSENNESE